MLKVGVFVFCLVVICFFLALGQRSRANNVFHLMVMVLWMLFMFVGNMRLPDMSYFAADYRLQAGVMLAWLGASYVLAQGCVWLLRRMARA